MSVLTSQELASSPALTYGDVLRKVPGLNVVQLSARDINITSRQATSTLSNSQLVLLDGRTVYLDFFGIVLWDLLPTNMSEIKQIEVIRGPASAVWGANALTGVVNIITKSPREAPGAEVSFTGGFMNRDAGSSEGRSPGGLFGVNAAFADAPNSAWSYRVSGGYFNAERVSAAERDDSADSRIREIQRPRSAARRIRPTAPGRSAGRSRIAAPASRSSTCASTRSWTTADG